MADANGYQPQDMFIDVGQRRLYLSYAGKGLPTVILEGGLGSASKTWASVQPAIAQFTRVCSYDRAGLGQSDPAPTPRTCQDMVDDLHTLLTRAHITPPYILVGHSMGGLNVRLYASQHVNEVVGMILVDSSHEDKHIHFEKVMSEDLIIRNRTYLENPSRNSEHLDVLASMAQIRGSKREFDFPLMILARGLPDEPSPVWPSADLQRIEVDLQRELQKNSPKSSFMIAEKSGHFIQNDEPGLIVDSIRQIVEMARQQMKSRTL